ALCPDVAGAGVESVRAPIRRKRSDRHRMAGATAVRGVRRHPIVTPWETPAVLAAGGTFPFRLRRQAHPERPRERLGLVPAHAHHRLIRRQIVAPCVVVPEAWRGDRLLLAPAP